MRKNKRFDLEYFLTVLCKSGLKVYRPIRHLDEWCVFVHLTNPQFRLRIRSSIRTNGGLSDPIGKNSIRIFLEVRKKRWEFVKQHEFWTQRTTGWEDRLLKKIASICKTWHGVRKILDHEDCGIRVNAPDPTDNGRAYAIYFDSHHPNGMLTYLTPKPSGSSRGRRLSRPTKGSQNSG